MLKNIYLVERVMNALEFLELSCEYVKCVKYMKYVK